MIEPAGTPSSAVMDRVVVNSGTRNALYPVVKIVVEFIHWLAPTLSFVAFVALEFVVIKWLYKVLLTYGL